MVDWQLLPKKLLFILNPMNSSASNDVNMAFQGYVEEQNRKNSHFWTLLSLTCLRNNTPKSYSLLLGYTWLHRIYHSLRKVRKKSQMEKKLRRNYVCALSLDKVLLMNSLALISEHKPPNMVRDNPGNWSYSQLSSFVFSMWNNHRGAERIKNRKEDWTWECPFTKKGVCSTISAKPTCIKKRKHIPGLSQD